MTADLFARAKGPRCAAGGWGPDASLHLLVCPWCGHDCSDAPYKWHDVDGKDRAVTACPECGKEFVCPDERGNLVCVGLLSPADPVLAVKRATLAAHGRPLDRARFIDALWAALVDAGAFPKAGLHAGLGDWLVRQGWAVAAPQFLTPEQQEDAVKRLSTWLRRAVRPKAPA